MNLRTSKGLQLEIKSKSVTYALLNARAWVLTLEAFAEASRIQEWGTRFAAMTMLAGIAEKILDWRYRETLETF